MTSVSKSNTVTPWRIVVRPPLRILDRPCAGRRLWRSVAGADRDLAVPARKVEYVARLTQAGDSAAQLAHQRAPLIQRRAEGCRAPRQIRMVQVIGLDPHCRQAAEQRLERRVGKECRS